MERRLFALLEFRDERRFLPGWLESVGPEVDGIVALDDGSTDGGAEILAGHPKLLRLIRNPVGNARPHEGAANRRDLHAAAGEVGADWLVVIDADERPEIGFGERARGEIERLESEGVLAASVWIRELWNRPDRVRVDGRWGEKRHARLYRWRPNAELDPRRLHGHAAPLDLRTGGGFPPADLHLYHLRMIRRADREARRARYERSDPDRALQPVGYEHLTDESHLELAPVPAGRGFRGAEATPRLKILITNSALADPAGSEWFVVDLARGLRRRGHEPMVYSPVLGEMAAPLRAEGIAVVDNLAKLGALPDVLHLQHRVESLTALARFPGVPAIHVCHGFRPWQEGPVLHPAVKRYVAVDEATRERVEHETGIRGDAIEVQANAVDLGRFRRRGALPERPRRALALHHRLGEENGGAALRAACASAGIELEIAGHGSGGLWWRPEERLGEFDLLFGHGRVALEGLVSGLAVIVFGPEGLGPYVEPGNFAELRRRNFGFRTQSASISSAAIGERIAAYDARKSSAVSDRARVEADLERALDDWVEIYRAAIEDSVAGEAPALEAASHALARDLRRLSLDLRELQSLAGVAYIERRQLADEADRRLGDLERFRNSVLGSRTFRWTERLRRLTGRGWLGGSAAAGRVSGRPKRILALLVFRDEMEFLPGWFENVAPEVDGVVALDDGSIDGSHEFVAAQRSVLEIVRLPRRDEALWDDGSNHRGVTEAALRHRPDWLLGVDADERLERGFGMRARRAIAEGERDGADAFFVTIRELWGSPDRFRVDGIWGRKRSARIFRARADHAFDPRRFHGVWSPLNGRFGESPPAADLLIYHLRMLTPERRRLRRERYERLDPNRDYQAIGYGYLTDESGLELATLPAGREYRPFGR